MFLFIVGTFGLDVSYGDTSPDFGRQILSQVHVNENSKFFKFEFSVEKTFSTIATGEIHRAKKS